VWSLPGLHLVVGAGPEGQAKAFLCIGLRCVDSPYDKGLASLPGLRGIWASNPLHQWAIGDEGAIVHYSGSVERGWTKARAPFQTRWNAIYGLTEREVWLLGDSASIAVYSSSADSSGWTLAGGVESILHGADRR
jgi:hypothetical protein